MKYREEDYKSVHEALLEDLQIDHWKFEEAIKQPFYDSYQKDIARAKLKQIRKRAHRLNPFIPI